MKNSPASQYMWGWISLSEKTQVRNVSFRLLCSDMDGYFIRSVTIPSETAKWFSVSRSPVRKAVRSGILFRDSPRTEITTLLQTRIMYTEVSIINDFKHAIFKWMAQFSSVHYLDTKKTVCNFIVQIQISEKGKHYLKSFMQGILIKNSLIIINGSNINNDQINNNSYVNDYTFSYVSLLNSFHSYMNTCILCICCFCLGNFTWLIQVRIAMDITGIPYEEWDMSMKWKQIERHEKWIEMRWNLLYELENGFPHCFRFISGGVRAEQAIYHP